MSEPGVPTAIIRDDITNVVGIPIQRERFRSWLRVVAAVSIITLIAWDIAMYSMYQTLKAHTDSLSHKMERSETLLLGVLTASQDPERLERLEIQITGIDDRVQDLQKSLKESPTESPTENPKTP